MTTKTSFRCVPVVATLLVASSFAGACKTEDPSRVAIENAYPAPSTGSAPANVVYHAWWSATYFAHPVAPGATSEEERAVPATDTAYVVLAPGWDPSSGMLPTSLVALKSKTPLSIGRGDLLTIRVSDELFTGNCAAQQPLAQDDADFVTQRIFPGDFEGYTYDAKTCTLTAAGADASAPAPADAGSDVQTSD